MMVGKDQEPLVLQDAMALGKDRLKLLREPRRLGVLDLARMAGRIGGGGAGLAEPEPLPDVEEVGQFGVVDVVIEGWVRDHRVDVAVGDIGRGRIPAGEIDRARGQTVRGPGVQDGGAHGAAAAEKLATGGLATSQVQSEFEGGRLVVERAQQAGLEEVEEGPR